MPSWLITGSGTGVGLALTKEILKNEDNFIIVTTRGLSRFPSLQELLSTYPSNRIVHVTIDVADRASVTKAVEEITPLLPNGLDHLINNAGSNPQPRTTLDDIDLESLEHEILFNTVATIHIIRSFLPLIRKSNDKKIVMITSILGSLTIAQICYNLSNSYSICKAAYNMIARKFGTVLASEGITTTLFHPGFVKTNVGQTIEDWMSKYSPTVPQITTTESAQGLLKQIELASYERGVEFKTYSGETLPW